MPEILASIAILIDGFSEMPINFLTGNKKGLHFHVSL
jgi:hypothetical protein